MYLLVYYLFIHLFSCFWTRTRQIAIQRVQYIVRALVLWQRGPEASKRLREYNRIYTVQWIKHEEQLFAKQRNLQIQFARQGMLIPPQKKMILPASSSTDLKFAWDAV